MISVRFDVDAIRPIAQAVVHFPMDEIDWQMVAIEAQLGGISIEAATAAMIEAERLFREPGAKLQDILPAARGVLAMLRYSYQSELV